MASITAYPGTLSQTTGGAYATFTDLNALKTEEGTARCTLTGKSGSTNTPSKIIATNFNFNVPSGANINQIIVEYAHWTTAENLNQQPSIPAPTLTLKNVNDGVMKGSAPIVRSYGNRKTIFQISPNFENINNKNFGIEIEYPQNTNESSGYLLIQYLKVTVVYEPVDYAIEIRGMNPVYIGDTIPITINITNINKNKYNPTVTIDLPEWVTFTNANGQGSITQNGDYLYWKVPFTEVGMAASITLYFLISNIANNQILIASEPVSNAGQSFIFNIVNDPSTGYIVETDDTNIVVVGSYDGAVEKVYVPINEELPISLIYPENDGVPTQMVHDKKPYKYSLNGGSSWETVSTNGGVTVIQDNHSNLKLKYTNLGKRTVTFKSNTGGQIFKVYEVHVTPESLGILSASVLTVDSEATDLMADGYVYTAQTYLKLNNTLNSEEFIDCGKNCRMIVFNAEIPSGTTDSTKYMIEHAEFISDCPTAFNTFQIISCDFIYNDEYPLRILFTSDYSQTSHTGFDLSYVAPAIIEKIVYNGYEPYGNYPYPINNVLSNSNLAEIQIPLFKQSNSFILSKPPLPEWYGSGDNHAVVGIELSFDIEYADDCVLYVKLHAPDGRIGTRSIVLNEIDNQGKITLGGLNDLFGFDVLDIQDFNKWEFECQFNNIFTNEDETANIIFHGATLTLHTSEVTDHYITMYIDGKDMRYYGLFLEEVDIPEGLETDTNYLNIDGTDTNEAYRQNIDKKTITVEFTIDGCDIHDTTLALRRIAKILVNERDSLNKPILKKVEFSHYPDVYWEYVIEDAIDSKIEYADYTSKVKLKIPSGTAKSVDDTITNNIGVNNSLAKVNPLISIIPTGSEIRLTETLSGQKFDLSNTGLNSKDIILIDCINRKVTVKKAGSNNTIQDITSSADYNNDWFELRGEFIFEPVNCMIQTVTFTERW